MMRKTTIHFRIILLIALPVMLFLQACRNETDLAPVTEDLVAGYDHEVVWEWNEMLLEIERFTPGYLPPIAARSFGYIGLAAYETAVPGMPKYRSLGSSYTGLNLPEPLPGAQYHYPAALNSAYLNMVAHLYPTASTDQMSRAVALYNRLNARFEIESTPQQFGASIEWGRAVADAVFAWSSQDVPGHEAYLRNTLASYVPPPGDGNWQPTYPDYGAALLPYWGDVRSFAARADDQCPPPLPYSISESSEFYIQARETENKVNLIRQGENFEDRWIAEFWSDDCPARTFTPAGRWIAIANQAIKQKSANLEKAVVVSAKVGMALCDAGIRCWAEKYKYNVMRPVEYIHHALGRTSWNTIMCPDGAGQFFTPSFPSYPSGHGTFGSAAAEVLTAEFGFSFPMTDACHKDRTDFMGTPRSFSSFYEMAQENAYSRIPLGVHFRMDSDAALELGFTVGRRVNQLPWQ